jgi:hypothetical protein
MVGLAISILWLLIGVIILLGVVWLAIYVVKMFVAIPAPIEKAIWIIVLILCLIGALSLIAGGGGSMRLGLGRVGWLTPGQSLVMSGTSTPIFVYNLDGTLAHVSLATLR